MKSALITGITGQDGSYLAQLLISKGYHVFGITRKRNDVGYENLRYLGIASQVVIEECDLTDLPSVIRILEKHHPHEIYNLAAQSSVGLSFEQPIGTIQFNIISVLNILEAIRIVNKTIKLYQASSSEMFGKVKDLPITLNTPMHPLSPYAISKASGFWTVVNFRESFNLFACSGVLFNHESYLRPANFFVKKVVSDSIKIKLGLLDKLSVGNLDVKRDFGYAPKYVEAMWLMLQQSEPQDFIICSGRSISLREVVLYVFKILNISESKIHVDHSLYRPTEIEDIYGDNSLAKGVLGWNYDLKIEEILDLIVDEHLKNLSIKHD